MSPDASAESALLFRTLRLPSPLILTVVAPVLLAAAVKLQVCPSAYETFGGDGVRVIAWAVPPTVPPAVTDRIGMTREVSIARIRSGREGTIEVSSAP